MHKIKIITRNGDTVTLPILEILEYDDQPFHALQPISLQGINNRLNIIEEAVAGMSDRLAEVIGHLFPPPVEEAPSTPEKE